MKPLTPATNPWLHRFAVLTALATFLLLGAGGLVTSHNAGMSVPDWPNSYGYNMFAFPPSQWVGGIFYEHTHRLWASAVGLMTTILAVWLWLKDPRRWMKWLGVAAWALVVVQGVLGGLRVVLIDADLGIVHGVIAQTFFVLTCALALFTSNFWHKIAAQRADAPRRLKALVLTATILIFCQLILGATMRGQHAGLSIPDFPLAYGKLWPDIRPAAVARYNAERMDVLAENPITAFQIILQMVHRLVAVLILAAVTGCAWQARKIPAPVHRRLSIFWLALIVGQISLGAATIWTNKAADVATLHLMGGALALATGVLWCVVNFRRATEAGKALGTAPAAAPLSGTLSAATNH